MPTVSPRGPPMRTVRSSCPSTTSATIATRDGNAVRESTPPASRGCPRGSSAARRRAPSRAADRARRGRPREGPSRCGGDRRRPRGVRCRAAVASGRRMTSNSRTSPPSTSTRPDAGDVGERGTDDVLGELAQLARVRRARDVERDDREGAGRHALDDDLRLRREGQSAPAPRAPRPSAARAACPCRARTAARSPSRRGWSSSGCAGPRGPWSAPAREGA